MLGGGGEDEVNEGGTSDLNREAEEAEWVNMAPGEEASLSRSESGEGAELETSALRRQRNVRSPGRPRGKGRRGYWVAKREVQVSRRPNIIKGGGKPTVRKDSNSKSPKVVRVKPEKGGRPGAGNSQDQGMELQLELP